MMNLAINGGPKVRERKFPPFIAIGEEEQTAVKRVLNTGCLSRFLACWHEDFFGGPEVRALEDEWASYFKVKHAIAVNSATSGLCCAVGAAGIGPGDEVIVSPYTMSASAVAPLVYNAIPVFADIEPEYFCLDPSSVQNKITKDTKAIIAVDIFGLPYDAKRINEIARKHNLLVIEDCAQAPGARLNGKFTGTLGDIGVYSLNYHKHIQSGEGGMVVTESDELADRVRLIRNHAEAIVEEKENTTLINMLGFNYRMTEIEAAIARSQLKKLSKLVKIRQENVNYFEEKIKSLPFIELVNVRSGSEHVYYLHTLKFKPNIAGFHRNCFVDAVMAELSPIEKRETEGVKIGSGYVKPIYLQPIFQNRIVYGAGGCPWTCERYRGKVSYEEGLCPNAEDMYNNILITNEYILPQLNIADIDDVIGAFRKVWEHRGELI